MQYVLQRRATRIYKEEKLSQFTNGKKWKIMFEELFYVRFSHKGPYDPLFWEMRNSIPTNKISLKIIQSTQVP